MFKKSARLSRSEFSNYFKTGKRHHSKHLTIITLPHPTLKVAVVVSKKVSPAAVRRNTLKRRVYASLRINLEDLSYQGVMILILKPSYDSLSRKKADELLRQSIAQAVKSA